MAARILVPSLLSCLFVSCAAPVVATSAQQAQPPARVSQPNETKPEIARQPQRKQPKQDEKTPAEEKRADKAKELRTKKRALEHARLEHRIAALSRTMREMAVAAAQEKATEELEIARRDLEHFRDKEKARELEQWQIRIDRSTQHAEQVKDELDELVAMPEADERAKTARELVLKRGRQSLEMARRSLDMTKKEFAEFREHALPKKERELERKVEAAGRGVRKAGIEAKKALRELELQRLKEAASIADLEEVIVELEKKLAGGTA